MSTGGRPPYVTTEAIETLVRTALAEDVGRGDVTSLATVPPTVRATATLIAKESGTVAGVKLAEAVFRAIDPQTRVQFARTDGDAVEAGDTVATVAGSARSILTAERTALNILQRMSGIATATRAMVDAARPHHARILDTRKTAPGLRMLDKWAIQIGGGQNHRMGLFDMILIKENHVAAAGGVRNAIRSAQAWCEDNDPLPIEIEVRSLDEVDEVLDEGGVDFILLDNMVRKSAAGYDVSLLAQAVERIDRRVRTEASGNVTYESVHAIAATGVDFISSGALTHSVRALDLSLLIRLDESRSAVHSAR